MHTSGMLKNMRATVNINEAILKRAADVTGVKGMTTLVHMGLEALVSQESAKRLACLGGTERTLKSIRRRRT